VQEGEPLVVDLRERGINSADELWDALADPCGLPDWFGRNLNAWNDTLGVGAISAVLDAHPYLIVRVCRRGFFASGADGAAFVEVTANTGQGRVDVEDCP
jgi:hypothetical protein